MKAHEFGARTDKDGFGWENRAPSTAIHAAMRADEQLEAGDLDGYAVWKRILLAVEELQGAAPKPGEAVH